MTADESPTNPGAPPHLAPRHAFAGQSPASSPSSPSPPSPSSSQQQPQPPAPPQPYGLDADIFRREALEHHARPRQQGDLLRLSPAWTRWVFWLLVAVFVVGGAYMVVGDLYEYASGPAVVRIEGKLDLTAKAPGVVGSVDVQPGQRVAAGAVLARFYVAEENAAYERVKHEFELQLVKVLRDPSNEAARQSLTSLRADKELAAARLLEKTVRAPEAGVISDIRVRPGQQLNPGEVVCRLVPDEAKFVLVAMLPGHYRPMLKPGMPLRLELLGYRYAYRQLVVDSVGDEVVGPNEIRRFLGPDVADAVQIGGPVVLVKAVLPSRSFVADDKSYNYFDGMQGTAEARVRAENVLVTFVPGLKVLFPHGD
jgi:biotin carboxyl carrier protein